MPVLLSAVVELVQRARLVRFFFRVSLFVPLIGARHRSRDEHAGIQLESDGGYVLVTPSDPSSTTDVSFRISRIFPAGLFQVWARRTLARRGGVQ